MKKDLLHTPEGVRDIYGIECREKSILSAKLRDVCEKFGYSEIQTPAFEFFDVFNSERGSVPSNEMFKFFDHHGNTLVLRPDITPSIARTAAKYFHNSKLPVKLYYVGDVFINHENAYRGQLKENTTVGAELIGNGDEDEDFEIVCMAVECMRAAGLTNFQVEIGNVRFFKGLMNEAGISEDNEDDLVTLINKKNFIGVEDMLEELSINEKSACAIRELPGLFGSKVVLDRARELSDNEDCVSAINRLSDLYEKLKEFGYEEYVSFDLGHLSIHKYYTGILFHAYTFGTGDAVLSGGRYDKLIKQFGTDKPSIGFSVIVDRLKDAVNRQNIPIPNDPESNLIVYTKNGKKIAEQLAVALRKEGKRTSLICADKNLSDSDYKEYASEWCYKTVYYADEEVKIM